MRRRAPVKLLPNPPTPLPKTAPQVIGCGHRTASRAVPKPDSSHATPQATGLCRAHRAPHTPLWAWVAGMSGSGGDSAWSLCYPCSHREHVAPVAAFAVVNGWCVRGRWVAWEWEWASSSGCGGQFEQDSSATPAPCTHTPPPNPHTHRSHHPNPPCSPNKTCQPCLEKKRQQRGEYSKKRGMNDFATCTPPPAKRARKGGLGSAGAETGRPATYVPRKDEALLVDDEVAQIVWGRVAFSPDAAPAAPPAAAVFVLNECGDQHCEVPPFDMTTQNKGWGAAEAVTVACDVVRAPSNVPTPPRVEGCRPLHPLTIAANCTQRGFDAALFQGGVRGCPFYGALPRISDPTEPGLCATPPRPPTGEAPSASSDQSSWHVVWQATAAAPAPRAHPSACPPAGAPAAVLDVLPLEAGSSEAELECQGDGVDDFVSAWLSPEPAP